MPEFLAHGVTVEVSTKRSDLSADILNDTTELSRPPTGNKEILVHFKNPL